MYECSHHLRCAGLFRGGVACLLDVDGEREIDMEALRTHLSTFGYFINALAFGKVWRCFGALDSTLTMMAEQKPN
jgi:hypothetical protein